jgi:ribosome recycling factor
MNTQRRASLTEALAALETAKGTIERVLLEEQDEYAKLSEDLQQDSIGDKIHEAISAMEEGCDNIDNAIDSITRAKEQNGQ